MWCKEREWQILPETVGVYRSKKNGNRISFMAVPGDGSEPERFNLWTLSLADDVQECGLTVAELKALIEQAELHYPPQREASAWQRLALRRLIQLRRDLEGGDDGALEDRS